MGVAADRHGRGRKYGWASTGHAHAIVGAIIERLALIHCRLLICYYCPSYVVWNTAIQYGGHYLFLIEEKSKRFNVELQDYYHQLVADLMRRDS